MQWNFFFNVSFKSDHVHTYLTIFFIPNTLSFWKFLNLGFVLNKPFWMMVLFKFIVVSQKPDNVEDADYGVFSGRSSLDP